MLGAVNNPHRSLYDVIILGASGFTGKYVLQLVCTALAPLRPAPAPMRAQPLRACSPAPSPISPTAAAPAPRSHSHHAQGVI
ncbi:hypothetical protein ACOSQ4_028439 [Xanthoceras sorbifolium]